MTCCLLVTQESRSCTSVGVQRAERTRQVDDIDYSSGLKARDPGAPGAGEDQCPSSNNQAGRAKFFLLHFVLFISKMD